MSFLNSLPVRLCLTMGLCAGMAGTAAAQGVPYGYGSYAYAEPLVRGDYIGAPLTRFPRPSDLVPSAWGYGTYGVPTVAGIRPAPVGVPTVYIVDSADPVVRRKAPVRSRVLLRERDGRWSQAGAEVGATASTASGARIIPVRAPRR